MLAKLRTYRPSHATVIAYIALFVALGGTSIAAVSLKRNSVKGKHIAKNAVTGPKVQNGSLLAGDFAAGQLPSGAQGPQGSPGPQGPQGTPGSDAELGGAAGGDLTGSYPNPQLAANAVGGNEIAGDSITGSDVLESTLGQVPSAALGGIGRWASSGVACDPDEPAFLTCAFTTINLPAPSRVLVIGTVKAQPEPGGSSATGQCRIGSNQSGFIALSGFTTGAGHLAKFVPMIGITPVQGPGVDDFGIECNEVEFDIEYFDSRVTAVALSPN